MSGHTKWSEIRDRLYAQDLAMAERVAAIRAREEAELSNAEAWEVELEAEPSGAMPSEDTLTQELVDAVCDGSDVLDADIEVRVTGGKLILVAVLFLAAVGTTEGSTSFSQAGKSADVLRLRLEDYGLVLQQTIRRAA